MDNRLHSASAAASQNIDLTNCDREPIHIPGSIQPHGLLIAFAEPDRTVVTVSENIASFAGIPAETIVGTPLDALFAAPGAEALRDALNEPDVAAANPLHLELNGRDGTLPCDGILHRHDGLVFLELEPHRKAAQALHRSWFQEMRLATRRLQNAASAAEACALAAREIRRVTGFDRVMIYRFHPDWSGEVVAEDRSESVPSYLGLFFPASDIPAQARALYLRNPIRLIPEVNYTPARLAPDIDPRTGRPVDLSFALLRSVSPIHLEYLRNMEVGASMSVSILKHGALWGLAACHHRTALYVPYEARQACELLVQALSWQIGVIDEVERMRHDVKVKALQANILGDVKDGDELGAVLARNGDAVLDFVAASGLALCTPAGITRIGRTPTVPQIEELTAWLKSRGDDDFFATHTLASKFPSSAAFADVASGVLAVPLSRPQPNLMLWFRPEIVQTVTWSGDPRKPVSAQDDDTRLHPRKSFAAWTEQVRDRAAPWQNHEISAALEIRDRIVDFIIRRAGELHQLNTSLQRVNDELEAFVYLAAHDLKEPARQIETFSGMLKGLVLASSDEDVGEFLYGLQASSRRLSRMISELEKYSRIDRQGRPFDEVDLSEVLTQTTEDLADNIKRTGTIITTEPLPVVVCDRAQMCHVFLNLLSNAIKYRHSERKLEIRVFARREVNDAAGEPEGRPEKPVMRICVQDNGIGFDPKYREQIFEPFKRLHREDEYEGTGIGLAICRKIVERHGGTVAAESKPGEGSTFYFTLPVRGSYPLNY